MSFNSTFGDILVDRVVFTGVKETLDEWNTPVSTIANKGSYNCYFRLNNGSIIAGTPNSTITIAGRIYVGPDCKNIVENDIAKINGKNYIVHLVNEKLGDHVEIDVVHQREA